MKVTDINLRDLQYDGQRACFRASVSMTMEASDDARPKRVNFICQSHREPDCPSSLITYDMVTHALEQAGQMPGFRRGEEQISVDISSAVTPRPAITRASA